MMFWLTIIGAMAIANVATCFIVLGLWKLYERHKLTRTKIERGNAAFEHLLNAQKTAPPPPAVTPFLKKVE